LRLTPLVLMAWIRTSKVSRAGSSSPGWISTLSFSCGVDIDAFVWPGPCSETVAEEAPFGPLRVVVKIEGSLVELAVSESCGVRLNRDLGLMESLVARDLSST